MRSFFNTRKEAIKEHKARITKDPFFARVKIYNLKKVFPNRKRKYFVGSYYDWLAIGA